MAHIRTLCTLPTDRTRTISRKADIPSGRSDGAQRRGGDHNAAPRLLGVSRAAGSTAPIRSHHQYAQPFRKTRYARHDDVP